MIESLLQKHLRNRRATTILDVGPGYGPFSRVVARITGATKIVYVDCSRAVLDWQIEESRKAGIEAEEVQRVLDAETASSLGGPYDIILCQEVLEHLREAEAVLQALAQRLSPGGRLVITVPTLRSERWLRRINAGYMANEPFGHVREFDEAGLRSLLAGASLVPEVFLPTQPHYFVRHTWVFGTRMQVEGSTGNILTQDFRRSVCSRLTEYSRRFFQATGPAFWGRVLPRNYFVIAAPAP